MDDAATQPNGGIESVDRNDAGQLVVKLAGRDDVRILSPTRGLFRDADGNIYELPDLAALDAASRKALHRYF